MENKIEPPFVLTSLNQYNIILRKDNLFYKPTERDMPLSIDCVVANEDRLEEVTDQLDLPSDQAVWILHDE
jgi:formyltetrahydrofolate hydrolase